MPVPGVSRTRQVPVLSAHEPFWHPRAPHETQWHPRILYYSPACTPGIVGARPEAPLCPASCWGAPPCVPLTCSGCRPPGPAAPSPVVAAATVGGLDGELVSSAPGGSLRRMSPWQSWARLAAQRPCDPLPRPSQPPSHAPCPPCWLTCFLPRLADLPTALLGRKPAGAGFQSHSKAKAGQARPHPRPQLLLVSGRWVVGWGAAGDPERWTSQLGVNNDQSLELPSLPLLRSPILQLSPSTEHMQGRREGSAGKGACHQA
ncbi:nucleoredoxin-like protein 1 isoform X2 [Cricetulus griseus]|uniref:Nucleoredoxin-like protein 1 isoform X2 n=1 Tax=Cricetulus griseus TaxID=10029 RepID=A0A9J7KDQ9_CRIGR|nr:nucleoredoxin-like protein 1 isoform X2 [Cricetulus griseus]